MYERFTDQARKVMLLANQEAYGKHIGTEDILLGLLKEGSWIVKMLLKDSGVNLQRVRTEVEKVRGPRPEGSPAVSKRNGPEVWDVLEFAVEEAEKVKHNYVGTEHILLGLLRVEDGRAAQILSSLGVKLEGVRQKILDLLRTTTKVDESSFVAHDGYQSTMALRDWFAGQALVGAAALHGGDTYIAAITDSAYRIADEMMKRRSYQEEG